MKLNQTQRNFMIQELISQLKVNLEKTLTNNIPPSAQATLKFLGHNPKDIFTADNYETKMHLNISYSYGWLREDVCTKKAQIRKQLIGERGVSLPTSWYENEFDAGHFTVDADFEGCNASINTGPPQIKIIWEKEATEKKRISKGLTARVTNLISRLVETSQLNQMLIRDANRYIKKATKTIMLTGVDSSEELLDKLTENMNNIFK